MVLKKIFTINPNCSDEKKQRQTTIAIITAQQECKQMRTSKASFVSPDQNPELCNWNKGFEFVIISSQLAKVNIPIKPMP